LGTETPAMVMLVASKSSAELRCSADSVPTMSPIVIEKSSAATVSSSVAGKRSTMDSATCWWVRIDRPEVALQRATEPDDVLHWQGLIESERMAHLIQNLRVPNLA